MIARSRRAVSAAGSDPDADGPTSEHRHISPLSNSRLALDLFQRVESVYPRLGMSIRGALKSCRTKDERLPYRIRKLGNILHDEGVALWHFKIALSAGVSLEEVGLEGSRLRRRQTS